MTWTPAFSCWVKPNCFQQALPVKGALIWVGKPTPDLLAQNPFWIVQMTLWLVFWWLKMVGSMSCSWLWELTGFYQGILQLSLRSPWGCSLLEELLGWNWQDVLCTCLKVLSDNCTPSFVRWKLEASKILKQGGPLHSWELALLQAVSWNTEFFQK